MEEEPHRRVAAIPPVGRHEAKTLPYQHADHVDIDLLAL